MAMAMEGRMAHRMQPVSIMEASMGVAMEEALRIIAQWKMTIIRGKNQHRVRRRTLSSRKSSGRP